MAALLYGVFQPWADYRNLSLNGELMMNLPIALSYWVAFLPTRRRWRPELILSGMLIVVAFLLKQPAAIAGLPLVIYVLSPSYRAERGLSWQVGVLHAAELVVGLGAALLLTFAVLRGYGILDEAIYWTILAHADPVGPTHLQYWIRGGENSAFFLVECTPLWGSALISLARPAAPFWVGKTAERHCLAMLLVVSLLGVSINGQFLFHYYLQLLPPLALLAAPVIAHYLGEPSIAAGRLAAFLVFTLVVFAVVDTIGLAQHRRPSAAAVWVKTHSATSDRLYVWGQGDAQTGMYLDADRRPASRFISPFPLTGHIFGGYPADWGPTYEDQHALPGAWDTLAVDFGRHGPRFVIDAEARNPGTRYPVPRYPALDQLLTQKYHEVAALPDGIVYQLAP
jgi:hypothetical protein